VHDLFVVEVVLTAPDQAVREFMAQGRPCPQARPYPVFCRELARGACPQAFRVTRPPIAGSEMLSRPVSTCPARRRSKLGSSVTVTTTSYQPWNRSSDSGPSHSARVEHARDLLAGVCVKQSYAGISLARIAH